MLELMRFCLVAGASEADFLAADGSLQEEFAYRQPGLLRRTTARGTHGHWIVVDVWRSAADAEACAARWDDDPVATRFMRLVDSDTLSTERYELLP